MKLQLLVAVIVMFLAACSGVPNAHQEVSDNATLDVRVPAAESQNVACEIDLRKFCEEFVSHPAFFASNNTDSSDTSPSRLLERIGTQTVTLPLPIGTADGAVLGTIECHMHALGTGWKALDAKIIRGEQPIKAYFYQRNLCGPGQNYLDLIKRQEIIFHADVGAN